MTAQRKKILVLDQNPSTRYSMIKYLKEESNGSVQVFSAGTGRQGHKILSHTSIDLILTSLDLPVMSGMEFLNHIRNHPVYRRIPAFAISDHKDESLEGQLKSWGHNLINSYRDVKPVLEQYYLN